MSPQEMQVLETFLNQLIQARAGAKDPQAEALIADAMARQPDAAYLLVQRALLLDQALSSAKSQIASLQNQLQATQAAGSTSFLDPTNAWGNSASSRPVAAPVSSVPASGVPASVPQQMPNTAPYAAVPPSRPSFLSSGFGSTLGNIATTAAGVAGGAFLFQGIENLLHHNSGSGFFSPQPMGSASSEPTVINNFYGSDDPPRERKDEPALDTGLLDGGLDNSGFVDDDSSII